MPKSLKLCLFTMMYFGKSQASEHNEQKEVNHRVLLTLTCGRRKQKGNQVLKLSLQSFCLER